MMTVGRREAAYSICEYFAGKHVLVTGFTGFLGKALVEKILAALESGAEGHSLPKSA